MKLEPVYGDLNSCLSLHECLTRGESHTTLFPDSLRISLALFELFAGRGHLPCMMTKPDKLKGEFRC